MGLNVYLESERGHAEAELLDPRGYVGALMALPLHEETVCLRFIDPYGNTVFNQLQIPVLVAELEALRESVTDAAVRSLAERRLDEARRANWSETVIRSYEAALKEASARPLVEHLDALLALVRSATDEPH